MFLHLGQDKLIPVSEVVMIGDLESATNADSTEEFLNIAKEEGFIIDYSDGKARSFVLTDEIVYYSMISSSTLAKRIQEIPGKDGGL
ncbi:MAG: extracellular matrix regulator RemB [Bacillota bacterium]